MQWLRGETAVAASEAEDARTSLLLEGFSGWEEHEELDDGLRLVFYCAMTDEASARVEGIEARFASVQWTSVDDEDWAHAWKRFWKPQRIGRRIVVKPTWEPFEPAAEDLVIELDPGMAFGTGTHATTRMCMVWLEDVVRGGERVLDVGTGSGILSVTALLLGARDAVAVDNDPIAVRTALENVALNGVAERARVSASDLTEALAADERFDVVVANIVADAIIALAPRLAPHLADGARFVASGIIVERTDDVRDALHACGFTQQAWRTEGEWASVCAAR